MEFINCNLCGSNDTKVLYEVKGRLIGKENFNIVQCKQCGLVYTNPRPTVKEIEKYYPPNYSPFKFSYPEPLFSNGIGILRRILKKKILMLHYGYFANSEIDPSKKNFLRNITLPLKYRIGWILPPYKRGGKILDIGCSTGHYLSILRQLGWDTYGVEPDSKSSSWARRQMGLNVVTGRFEEIDFPLDYFDVVTLWHTLEHFHNPLAALRKVHGILKKDGLIIFAVPDISTLNRKIFGTNWWAWEVPRHLYHFSFSTIVKLLCKDSFKLLRVERPPYLAITILSLQNLLVGYFPKGEKWAKRFLTPENSKLSFLLSPIGWFLSFTGQTGEMMIYARK